MNNFYTIIYLSKYLKNKLTSFNFLFSISPHKNVWEGYFSYKQVRYKLVFSSAPSETALFLNNYKSPKKSNTLTFFEQICDHTVTDIRMPERDRYVEILFDSELKLIFQLFGNNPNIFLIKNNLILDSFKDPSHNKGKEAPEPRPPRAPKQSGNYNSVKQAVIETDPAFPRHLIPYLEVHYKPDPDHPGYIAGVVNKLKKGMLEHAEFRVIENGQICLVPNSMLPVDTIHEFDNVNDAIRHVYYKTSNQRRLSEKAGKLLNIIQKRIDQDKNKIRQLEEPEEALERAEEYEKTGHILMAHAHAKQENYSNTILLNDIYNQNEKIEIEIDPGLSFAENAQKYYEKSSKTRRRIEEAKKRKNVLQNELDELEKLLDGLNKLNKIYEFEEWEKTHSETLEKVGLASRDNQKKAAPFKKTDVDGYEVWVGKNAKSNDLLTKSAHKEDIWLHARGVSGSHVVIRMENNKDMPQKTVILKAASIAAWHSGARGSKLVPVIYTKCKYVTKPRGAPAGAVTVQREQVEMVEPKKEF